MRRALHRQWTCTPRAEWSHGRPRPERSFYDEVASKPVSSFTRVLSSIRHAEEEQKRAAPEPSVLSSSLATEQLGNNVLIRKQISQYLGDTQVAPAHMNGSILDSAKSHGRDTFAFQSGASSPQNRRKPDDWARFLEAVRAQRRHFGPAGAWVLYIDMIERKLNMPTEGKEAAELWDHFVQTGSSHPKGLWVLAKYAIGLYERTSMARSDIYQSIVGTHLWRYPNQALAVHQLLKPHFPPRQEDFEALLRLALHAGLKSSRVLGRIYQDHPVPDVYSIVVPELCKRDMYTEATKWHFLLVEKGDLPRTFHDCKALFQHYSQLRDGTMVEALAKSLVQKRLWFEEVIDNYVQDDKFISQEIMNRALGQRNDNAPQGLSDGFCARLFATKFFSVTMIVSGLHMMGLETLGPSSVRELVVRDGYRCETIVQHIEMLRDSEIPLRKCRYNTIIERAATDEQVGILKSMTSTDLHPDTFEDNDLQERLLALYCKQGDHEQLERTLAVFRSTTPEKAWETYRANLLLRCHISLRDRQQILAILRSMQQNRYPLAPRSSRHLRTALLSPRRKGAQPINSRQALQDINLVINAMRMSLQAGYYVPIDAWTEILKRLGMGGHLDRYQGLALWLVSWYSRPEGSRAPQGAESTSMQLDQTRSSPDRVLTKSADPLEFTDQEMPVIYRANAQTRNWNLLKIFGKSAQQSMIAWGFQAEVKRRPNVPYPNKPRYADPQTHWQWGLRLLKELQLRGVPVDRLAVARACKLRLAQLFRLNRVSKRGLNCRAKVLNEDRSELVAKFRLGAYIKGIEEIWGRDLMTPTTMEGMKIYQVDKKPA